MASAPPVLLVDGSSYLYRAFHALPPLTTAEGQPTGAIKGVVNMLKSQMRSVAPTHVAVVFDAPGKTFRDDIYPEYKAHRPPMPDEMRAQIEPLHAVIRAMGLPLLCVPGVEADDVIGTLAWQAAAAGQSVLISTGDKDLAQLVNDQVQLINTMTSVHLDIPGVMAKFGVRPDQFIDYLMLVGDTSDGIPGVPGVGPKTAAKWLAEFGSLDALLAQADQIKGKTGERLRAHQPLFEMTRRLVQIDTQVALDVTWSDLCCQAPDQETLRTWYERLAFRGWLQEVSSATTPVATVNETSLPVTSVPAETDTVLVQDEAGLTALADALRASTGFAFDTETTSLDYFEARLVGLAFSVRTGHAWYVPVGHIADPMPQQLTLAQVIDQLGPILGDPLWPKWMQHAKYDRHVLANHGIPLAGVTLDTMLASYVLDATATRHNLSDLATTYLGLSSVSYESVVGKGAQQINFSHVPLAEAARYAGEDADLTGRLARRFRADLDAVPALAALHDQLELPCQDVLWAMERHGTLIDPAQLHEQSLALSSQLHWLESEAYTLAGETFNLNSPKQLGVILFDKLGLPAPKKTATGQYATSEDILETLDHPLAKALLSHRSLSKLKSTYTDKLQTLIKPRTGRLHTSYHQAVTATGRLSSSDPNLQNIPIRTAEGRRVRQAFIAAPGCVLMAADYSQIELRIMAHLSGDESLLTAFQQDRDVHRATAAEVLDIPLEAVTADQRRAAKAVNFGLIYGMSAFGLARQLGIPRGEAQAYIDRYFARYPGVLAYMNRTRALAHEQGYVETLWGRRLMLKDIRSTRPGQRQAAERAAINAPMQGTAADIVKRAMLRVQAALTAQQLKAALLMQVHDELVLEVPEAEIDTVRAVLLREMPAAATLAVPLKVEVGVGSNWDAAH